MLLALLAVARFDMEMQSLIMNGSSAPLYKKRKKEIDLYIYIPVSHCMLSA
jgi:hypothetical protein